MVGAHVTVARGAPDVLCDARGLVPGLRRYTNVRNLPHVLGGMGVAILTTSKGVMSDAEARKQKLGGELICTVY